MSQRQLVIRRMRQHCDAKLGCKHTAFLIQLSATHREGTRYEHDVTIWTCLFHIIRAWKKIGETK